MAKREAEEAKQARKAEATARKEAEWAVREKAKREAEEAKKAREAEVRVEKEAELAAKEKAKKETEEAKKAREAEERAKEEAELAAKEKAKREAEEVSAELHEGMVELVILSPIDLGQMKKLEEALRQVQDLRLLLIGGSLDEGIKIVISAGKPIPLVSILREMPPVEQVVKKGKEIQVSLRANL